MLRVLLGVNLLALAVAFIQSPGVADWAARYVEMAALVEPLLLLVLGLLAGLRNPLRALPLRLGQACVMALVAGLAYAQSLFWQSLGFGDGGNPLRPAILAAARATGSASPQGRSACWGPPTPARARLLARSCTAASPGTPALPRPTGLGSAEHRSRSAPRRIWLRARVRPGQASGG